MFFSIFDANVKNVAICLPSEFPFQNPSDLPYLFGLLRFNRFFCFTRKTVAYLKCEHGGIGAIAASEVIYSMGSGWFTMGIFDGLWDNFYPAYPQPQPQDFIRPAAALAYGKYFLEFTAPSPNPQINKSFYHLFGFLGEPYALMFDEVPQELSLYHGDYINPEQTSFSVGADSGAWVALTLNGEIIGVEKSIGETVVFNLPPHELGDTFHVTATKQNFRRYDNDVECSNAVSIAELHQGNLKLFPNPAGNYLKVKMPHFTGIACILIYDLRGTCVRKVTFGPEGEALLTLDISELSPGLYFLELIADTQVFRQKFIVERQ